MVVVSQGKWPSGTAFIPLPLRHLTFIVRYGNVRPTSMQQRTYRIEPFDPKAPGPYVTFIFRYRSQSEFILYGMVNRISPLPQTGSPRKVSSTTARSPLVCSSYRTWVCAAKLTFLRLSLKKINRLAPRSHRGPPAAVSVQRVALSPLRKLLPLVCLPHLSRAPASDWQTSA